VVHAAPVRADAPDAPAQSVPDASVGHARERALVDAWREAHWSLRMKLQELSRHLAGFGVETLYDDARRCDNLLNEFYQARAEVLARQLRDQRETRPASQPGAPVAPVSSAPASGSTPRLTISERALLARVRELGPEDRAVLLRLAVQMARTPRARHS
jgi:hypothetical protein